MSRLLLTVSAVALTFLLVCWSIGPLVYRSIGLLVYWSIGLLIYWSLGLLVSWSIGVLVYWHVGLLVYWSVGEVIIPREKRRLAAAGANETMAPVPGGHNPRRDSSRFVEVSMNTNIDISTVDQ